MKKQLKLGNIHQSVGIVVEASEMIKNNQDKFAYKWN